MRWFGLGSGVVMVLLLAAPAAPAATLNVSPQGNDAWSGRLASPGPGRVDGPLASLAGARDAIRKLKASGSLNEPVTVQVQPGTYLLSTPFVLEPQDSGTPQAPITYRGDPRRPPVISGGQTILGFQDQDGRWIANLPIDAAGAVPFGALWVNGQRRTLARTPNTGYLLTAGKAAPLHDPATGKEEPQDNIAFRFRPGDIPMTGSLQDMLVVVYHNWETSIHRVKSIDPATHTITFTAPAPWAFTKGQRYIIKNIPEALDSPGEWYLDRRAGRLTYLPMPGEEIARTVVTAPVAQQLIVLDGNPAAGQTVDDIHFENLKLYYTETPIGPQGHADGQAEFSIDAAVQCTGARRCLFQNCEIAHTSNYGVWLRAGCQENRIEHCELHDLGAGGVRIGEGGSPASPAEAAAANAVDNNYIHDTGTIFQGAVGVWIGRSSYNTVSHNDIGDMDYTAISVGWLWGYEPSTANHNIIEYNHIHNIGRGVMSDMGAIYTLGISPGTVERGNVIHDIYCYPGGYGGWGVYTDEGSSDILIENNLVFNTSSGCFHQHYGQNNILRNNIFAYGIDGVLRRTREETHNSFTLEHNLVVSNGTPFQVSGWSNNYYTIDNNLYWNYADPTPRFYGMTLADWQAKGHDQHSIVADPLFARRPPAGSPVFVGATREDFQLRPGSPASRIGFTPFPMQGAGLYGDRNWVSLPARYAAPRYYPPPPAPPEPIADGFEETPVGQVADGPITNEEGKGDSIRVTDETAASGKHSLKFVDVPGLAHAYNPHLFYSTHWTTGTLEEDMDLRLEPGAVMYHEWRDADTPYHVGPAYYVSEDGQLTAGGKPLLKIIPGQWMHLHIRCNLGQAANGKFDLSVTLPGQAPAVFKDLACSPEFHTLTWLGFSMNADKHSVMYLDNLNVREVTGGKAPSGR